MPLQDNRFLQFFVAELVGTFILVFFGLGSVHTAVLMSAQQGVWQVAVVWGIAIMLAIYAVGAVSGAHLNPAISLAMTVYGKLSPNKLPTYVSGQLSGAFLAAACLYLLFAPQLERVELQKQVVRGEVGSEITACCYGEFFPNPGGLASGTTPYSSEEHLQLRTQVPHGLAFLAELFGTTVLGFVVFAVTSNQNKGRPASEAVPIFIGLTVAALISVIGPLTQACFNPARDFAPRLFSALVGWGFIALPADLSWITVYIMAPCLGAILGGGIWQHVIQPLHQGARNNG
ncbi:MAG: aquaporin family protein [Planctomycetales bacterium]|nr:aquaporin family protein [Planctomycetales bacterium]